ncbi:MAG TPA: UbiD family decarboxylase [Syntrophorhabdales bacterium]|nr:UbiD family decarboxylase [Syntrophorhabdales bacterium]
MKKSVKVNRTGVNMPKKDPTSIRSALAYLEGKNEILHVKGEVDPIYEIAGIAKSFEKGPILMFEKIKGYPNFLDVANLFGRRAPWADVFGVQDPNKMKFKFVDALHCPIPPKVVKDAPVQEVVIDKHIDVLATLPVIKHTEFDAGRIMGCGNQLLCDTYRKGDTNISFNRIHFRGKNWASISTAQITHIGTTCFKTHRDARIPVTVNINPPPAVGMVAGAWHVRTIVPHGSDELGIAGRVQGAPIELVKARTVDAYAIANAEIVLEGYLEPTSENVWESDESERLGVQKQGETNFFPEWVGYMGTAWKVRKLTVTAMTMRKTKPIFYTPLAAGLEYTCFDFSREASFFELAERIAPGICVDVNIPDYFKWGSGVIFQIRKERAQDEGFQRNILMAALADAPGMRMAIAVDEDVDIYCADDVMWALESRVDPDHDVLKLPRGMRGIAAQPLEVRQSGIGGWEGGLAFDATKPYRTKHYFQRPQYPVNKINLKKWFTEEQIQYVRAMQTDYAKALAKRGW